MKALLSIVLLGLSATCFAQFRIQKPSPLNSFRAGGILLYGEGRSSLSLLGTWNPELYRSEKFVFRLSLGGSVFESEEKKKFLMVETLATFSREISKSFSVEAGLGVQSLSHELGQQGVGVVSVHRKFKPNRYQIQDTFLGYSRLNLRGQEIHQVRAGVSFRFK